MKTIQQYIERLENHLKDSVLILQHYPDATQCTEPGLWNSLIIQPAECNHLVARGRDEGISLLACRRFGQSLVILRDRFADQTQPLVGALTIMQRENPSLYQDLLTFIAGHQP